MRTLKLVLTEDNGETGPGNVPIVRSTTKEITDTEIKAVLHGKEFNLMTEIKKLSDRLGEMAGPTACSCGSNDVKYDHRDEITVCQSCGTYW